MTPSFPTLQIPYRSLVPADTNGLAAGRNLSADTKSHAALREIPECWAMGEAAGVAAVLAVDGGTAVRDVDIKALQAQLVEQGSIVDLLRRRARTTQRTTTSASRSDPLAGRRRRACLRVKRMTPVICPSDGPVSV